MLEAKTDRINLVASARIVILGGQRGFAEQLSKKLSAAGCPKTICAPVENWATSLPKAMPNLVVLCCDPDRVTAIELVHNLRSSAETNQLPVIVIDSCSNEDRLTSELSFDPVVCRIAPFSFDRFKRCLTSLLNRETRVGATGVVEVGDLKLDNNHRTVTRGLRKVRLSPTGFKILRCFMTRAGQLMSRQQLIEAVWGCDARLDDRTVDVHIGRLRSALIRGNERDPIQTNRGAGYMFNLE